MRYKFRDQEGKPVYLRGYEQYDPVFDSEPSAGDVIYSDERNHRNQDASLWSGKIKKYIVMAKEHHFRHDKNGRHEIKFVLHYMGYDDE